MALGLHLGLSFWFWVSGLGFGLVDKFPTLDSRTPTPVCIAGKEKNWAKKMSILWFYNDAYFASALNQTTWCKRSQTVQTACLCFPRKLWSL